MAALTFVQNVRDCISDGNKTDDLQFKFNFGTAEFTISLNESLVSRMNDLVALKNNPGEYMDRSTIILQGRDNTWRRATLTKDVFIQTVFTSGALPNFMQKVEAAKIKVEKWFLELVHLKNVMNWDIVEFEFTGGKEEQHQYFFSEILPNFKKIKKIEFEKLEIKKTILKQKSEYNGTSVQDKKIELIKWLGFKVTKVPSTLEEVIFNSVTFETDEVEKHFIFELNEFTEFKYIHNRKSKRLTIFLKPKINNTTVDVHPMTKDI